MFPTLEEVAKIANEKVYKTVPVTKEILSDIRTPIEVLRILQNVSKHCYMLESAADNEVWGRYSFLGYDPKLEITCLNGDMKVGDKSFKTDHPRKYIKEVLEILENRDGSNPLLQKACNIAGILLELAGVAQPHTGYEMALSFVKSGKALDKMKEIIAIQGGDRNITSKQLKLGGFSFEFTTEKRGYVGDMNNKLLVSIAREAGSPADKGAGLFFNRKRGELVHKGDVLFTIYADKEWKLKNAIALSQKENPYMITEMLQSRITES